MAEQTRLDVLRVSGVLSRLVQPIQAKSLCIYFCLPSFNFLSVREGRGRV